MTVLPGKLRETWLFPQDAQRDALSAKGASQARSMFALFTG